MEFSLVRTTSAKHLKRLKYFRRDYFVMTSISSFK